MKILILVKNLSISFSQTTLLQQQVTANGWKSFHVK